MEGKKNFIVTISVSNSLRNKTRIRELKALFLQLCSEMLSEAYRANVSVKDNKKGKYYHFIVSFGERRVDEEAMASVVENLAKTAFYNIKAKASLQRADEALDSAIKTYQGKCHKKQQHITVKPNQHIRLC